MTPTKKINPNAIMFNNAEEAMAYAKANPTCSKEEAKAELDKIREDNCKASRI